jgi:hypothetical protein
MKQPTEIPSPGEWHPWYENKRPALQSWLDGEGPLGNRPEIRLAVPPVSRLSFSEPDSVTTVDGPQELILVKIRCRGLAPFVGRPFCYTWWAAYDQYQRCITGDVSIEYTVSEFEWMAHVPDA